jgi:hypothetical protein
VFAIYTGPRTRASPWKFKRSLFFLPLLSLVAVTYSRNPGKVRGPFVSKQSSSRRRHCVTVATTSSSTPSDPFPLSLALRQHGRLSMLPCCSISTPSFLLCILYPLDDAAILASSSNQLPGIRRLPPKWSASAQLYCATIPAPHTFAQTMLTSVCYSSLLALPFSNRGTVVDQRPQTACYPISFTVRPPGDHLIGCLVRRTGHR